MNKLLFLIINFNFILLNRKLYIFLITVLFSFGANAQAKTLLTDPVRYIRFYPNPAITSINFEFQKEYDKSLSLQVYNFIGKKVLDISSVTPKLNISLNDFYRGVYIYQLRDRSGRILESGKFQVTR